MLYRKLFELYFYIEKKSLENIYWTQKYFSQAFQIILKRLTSYSVVVADYLLGILLNIFQCELVSSVIK